MQLQVIPMPMPIYYPVDSGPSAPITDEEAKFFLAVIISIYILWIISFFITWFLYKKSIKKGEKYYFRDNGSYREFRYDSPWLIIDAIMVIGILSFLIYTII
jgi:heme/copper-type cytochrome/quinol oxidase subunit 2